jgi:hypothetical protein
MLQGKCNEGKCTPQERAELDAILAKDRETTIAFNNCALNTSAACNQIRADFVAAAASYLPNKNEILIWATNKSIESGGKYTVAQIYDAYNASFFGIAPSDGIGDLSPVADWMRSEISSEPPLSKIAMGAASYQNQQWAAYFGVAMAANLMAQAKNMLAPEPLISGKPATVVSNGELLDQSGQVIARQNSVTGKYEVGAKGGTAAGEAAGVVNTGLNVPGRVQSRINVSNEGMGHVVDRHFDSSVNASQFTISEGELRSLLQSQEVVSAPVLRTVQSGNELAYVREINLGSNVGLDKFSGNLPTSTLTVMTDKYGNLITTFPGKLK